MFPTDVSSLSTDAVLKNVLTDYKKSLHLVLSSPNGHIPEQNCHSKTFTRAKNLFEKMSVRKHLI